MCDSRNEWNRREGLVQRIDAKSTWADIALPEQQVRVLRELVVSATRSLSVSADRRPEIASAPSRGILALFSGANGTGKIMAAEVLAQELRLNLYRVDLARVVSKYIGETEKNLFRIFSEANANRLVLLLDEADALLGRRTEVKDGHDRYANIEISYLLQRLDEYDGLVILAGKAPHEWMPSLRERIEFVVEFSLCHIG